MPDASSEASFIHWPYILRLAHAARDRAKDVAARDPVRLADDATAALLLAAAAIEGFINEVMHFKEVQTMPMEVAKRLGYEGYVEASRAVKEIERKRGRTELKYMTASRWLSGQMFDRGSAPLQDVVTLFDIRNMIMHIKPVEQNVRIVNGNQVWSEMPEKIKALQAKGLTRGTGEGSWFWALQTSEMAAWACETARGIIRATIAMLPPGFHRNVQIYIIEELEAKFGQNGVPP